ncbi:hypothetical protein PORY_000624 [Pneumocystis oryctolagi]|uniref:Uncharacterized protein n=1 Tax=Pneumocystis oryctolagi TaxID=42067 RepID=A0ACB7CFP6_9ASCO|nr:hypothetical protein PORY_000624 [Pneumocystis oryctolagi]
MRSQILNTKRSHLIRLFNRKEINCHTINVFHVYISFKRFFSSYYDILDVPQNAKKFHPDLHRNNKEACKKFLKIKEAYEVLNCKIKQKEYNEKVNNSQEFYPRSFHTERNTFYNELNQKTQENINTFKQSDKERNDFNFSNYQYSQKDFNNTNFSHTEHYETYYTYKNYRIKHLNEKNLLIPKRGLCSANFLSISMVVLIAILLSSYSHININKKSKKYSLFQKPLS